MTILIGCDPELFVYDAAGKPVCAQGLIPGSKYEPHEVDKGAIQVDGVAVEFNIDPAESSDDFVANIVRVEHQLVEAVREKDKGYILRATPTVKFTRKQWEMISDEAKALGCEPDYNAYSLLANAKPTTDKFMRTGSGHIHISWGQKPEDVRKSWLHHCASLITHLDYHLYPNSLIWDKDKERQELYGKPGAFRPKSYGVEYRTLSNAWVRSEKTMRYVFDTAKLCTEKWFDGYRPDQYTVPVYEA